MLRIVEDLYGPESPMKLTPQPPVYWEWDVRVSFKLREYGTSFQVLFFLGPGQPTGEERYLDMYKLESFVGSQKVSCKKALARAFAKYTLRRDGSGPHRVTQARRQGAVAA